MPTLVDLLLAFGICFGLQNKVEFLRSEKWPLGAFFTAMLGCSYCTGFHAGWLAWAITRPFQGFELTVSGVSPVLAWAFASSAFCYLLDAGSQAAERAFQPKD